MIDFDKWWAAVGDRDDRDGRPVVDADGYSWLSMWDRFWCGTAGLNLCGCGSSDPQRVMAKVLWALYESHYALELHPEYTAYDPKDPRYPRGLYGEEWFSPMVELCLHILAAKGFLDHGGSVGSGWLTPDGVAAAGDVFNAPLPTPAPEATPQGG